MARSCGHKGGAASGSACSTPPNHTVRHLREVGVHGGAGRVDAHQPPLQQPAAAVVAAAAALAAAPRRAPHLLHPAHAVAQRQHLGGPGGEGVARAAHLRPTGSGRQVRQRTPMSMVRRPGSVGHSAWELGVGGWTDLCALKPGIQAAKLPSKAGEAAKQLDTLPFPEQALRQPPITAPCPGTPAPHAWPTFHMLAVRVPDRLSPTRRPTSASTSARVGCEDASKPPLRRTIAGPSSQQPYIHGPISSCTGTSLLHTQSPIH